MELVESRGGGWEIIEPCAERLAALGPASFDPERLRAHYAGEREYYPDEEDAEDQPGLLGRMLDRLLPAAPERHPAGAGEEMLRHIALLRRAHFNIRDGNVLLVHLYQPPARGIARDGRRVSPIQGRSMPGSARRRAPLGAEWALALEDWVAWRSSTGFFRRVVRSRRT
jgi:hypothetical protein